MMTLGEAIDHALEKSRNLGEKGCIDCAEEHMQLAKFLMELRDLKEKQQKLVNAEVLDPCPFCGSKVSLERKPLWHGSHGYHDCYEYTVRCNECGCNIRLYKNTTIYNTDDEAKTNVIKAWNTRIYK